MNKDTVGGELKILKGKIRKAWGQLTDDEIEAMQGDLIKLEGQLQKTYGQVKAESEKNKSAHFSALLFF